MGFSSSSSTLLGPSTWSPNVWLYPGSCPDEGANLDDACCPDPWPSPRRGLFGDTAFSLSDSLSFGVSEFSIVEMPQMIPPPPAQGWETNPAGAASPGPRVEAPQPVPTRSTVQAPLNVTISPEGPAADPQTSGQ
jgi:hypothetical protein